MALQRADGEDNTKAVLKFLLQWFDSNSAASTSAFSGGGGGGGDPGALGQPQQGPLTIDHRIIDQLGCIIISRTRIDDAYKNIMNKFKEIIKEASAMVKIGKGVGK